MMSVVIIINDTRLHGLGGPHGGPLGGGPGLAVLDVEDLEHRLVRGVALRHQPPDGALVRVVQRIVHVDAELRLLLGEQQSDLQRVVRGHAQQRLLLPVLRRRGGGLHGLHLLQHLLLRKVLSRGLALVSAGTVAVAVVNAALAGTTAVATSAILAAVALVALVATNMCCIVVVVIVVVVIAATIVVDNHTAAATTAISTATASLWLLTVCLSAQLLRWTAATPATPAAAAIGGATLSVHVGGAGAEHLGEEGGLAAQRRLPLLPQLRLLGLLLLLFIHVVVIVVHTKWVHATMNICMISAVARVI